jgi:hypothetical protein
MTIRSCHPILLVVVCTLARAAAPPRYTCTLVPGPPVRVRVYREINGKKQQVGPALRYGRKGKMASAADVDGDGALDLLVLVHKKTRYDPKLAWRPFVYTLQEGEWFPKWLGSRLARPLQEAAFVHTPQGVRLLTVEQFARGKSGLTMYHWTGFGFRGEWTGRPAATMSRLQVEDADSDGVDEVSVISGGVRRRYLYRDGGYVSAPRPKTGGSR